MAREPRTSRVRICSRQRAVRVPRKQIAALTAFAARAEGTAVADVDVAVVCSREIAGLNRRYLHHGGPTDVLSFDLSEGPRRGLSGQIVVCGDVAARQGPLHGQSVRRELLLYVLHGLLHLMGYEDRTVRGAVRMHAREEEILDAFLRCHAHSR